LIDLMKNCKLIARLTVLTSALVLHSHSWAQSTLSVTVVTANRSEQLLTDALPHTTVIGRDLIERSSAIDLPNLLASEAGFQFTQNGGRGTASTLFLRGSAAMQVLVLIDGVPLTKQDSTGTVSIEHIMLDQIERVEIVRGNVSAIYGSGAIGGVIQVFTRSGSGKPAAYVKSEFGALGTASLVTGASGKVGDTRFTFGVGRHVSSGFSSMNASQYPSENPDADGYQNTNYNFALSQELTTGQTVGFRTQGSDGRFDTDGGGFGSASDVYTGRSKLDTMAFYSHNQISTNWRSEVTFSEGRERSIYDATLTTSPYSSEALTRVKTLNVTQLVGLGSWLVTAGAETQNQRIDATDNYASDINRQRDVTSYFGGLSGKLGLNSMQLNIRRDSADDLASKTTSYAGYGYQLTPSFKLIASISTSLNLPPLGYLYDPYYGNTDLKPETARSKEIGVQWAKEKQVLRATYFDTRVEDQLQYNFDTSTFGNISSASNKGVEVSYSGHLYGTDLRGSLTLQDPMNESTGEQLVRRPRVMASLGASKLVEKWTFGGDFSYTGTRPDASGNPDLGAYVLANLTARYPLSQQVAFTSRVINVLDRKYQTAYGYNQTGRALYAGLIWQMK